MKSTIDVFLPRTLLFMTVLVATAMATVQGSHAQDQDDDALDEAIRQFGYYAGAAQQCLSEDKQSAHERRVLDAFTGVSRLFGTDISFYFAAAYGFGTSDTIDRSKCDDHIRKVTEALDKGRLVPPAGSP